MSNIHHTAIELLAVELWLEVFDYFNVNDLWYSFRDLNKKIDAIIDQTQLHLNFEKEGNYDYFIKNIQSSIDIANVRSNQLSSLKYLQSLKIIFRANPDPNNDLEEKEFIIHSIFNQDFCPLLTCLVIRNNGSYRPKTGIPSLIKTTKTTNIKYLSIDCLTLTDLIKLFPALQNIKSICTDDELSCDNEFNAQQEMTTGMPLMSGCNKLDLVLSDDITFEHIEWILKHTPNLKDLLLWSSFHLLDAKEWELLLSAQCLKLLKLVLTCTGPVEDYDFEEAGNDFEEECKTKPFWIERNATVTHECYPNCDSFYLTVVQFNIGKSKQPIELN